MNHKAKILVFIDWFLPAYKAGGPVRSIANMIGLLGDEFNFFIVTGNKEFGESTPMEIEANVWHKRGKANVIYLSDDKLTKENYLKIQKEIAPDLIYLNSLFSQKFTLLPLRTFKSLKKQGRIILAPRGMFGKESLKIKSKKKKIFLFTAKRIGLFNAVIWHASSIQEKQEIIANVGSGAIVKIAPNVPYLPENWNADCKKEKGTIKIISVGRIVPIKNIHFKLKCLAAIDSNINVQAKFIGPLEDEEYYKVCKSLADKLPENSKVEFLGELPHAEIEEHYLSSELYLSATLNENFGHGIVEAFGYGCPVVISDKTPWKNLQDHNVGFDLQLNEKAFIDKIEYFANLDADQFCKYSESARKFAESMLTEKEIKGTNMSLFQIV